MRSHKASNWCLEKCKLKGVSDMIINEAVADFINDAFNVNAVSGQKLSRVINNICHKCGTSNHEDYNRLFAIFSKQLNPIKEGSF